MGVVDENGRFLRGGEIQIPRLVQLGLHVTVGKLGGIFEESVVQRDVDTAGLGGIGPLHNGAPVFLRHRLHLDGL